MAELKIEYEKAGCPFVQFFTQSGHMNFSTYLKPSFLEKTIEDTQVLYFGFENLRRSFST